MIGQTISHYKITGKLGGGDLDVAYEAKDTRLGRPLVSKLLPEPLSEDLQALFCFKREPQASVLNRPPG